MKKIKINSNGDSAISRIANQSICPNCGAKVGKITKKCVVCGWKNVKIERKLKSN